MDVANVNISKLYGIVSAAGEKQVLNVSEDEKGLSLSDGGAELTPEQIEANRKFHQGLLESLQGITGDKAVLDEVRSKLGLSQGGAKAESILARDIKSVIDLVMSKVSKRIDEVLTQRKFPDVVNKLIIEAVKANPKHDVVKAFLQEGGGTLDNLARLCRLTCQSLKGGANSAALAYLNGFAYKVADFENVQRISVSDNQQYADGVSHYEEEKRAREGAVGASVPRGQVKPKPLGKDVEKLGKALVDLYDGKSSSVDPKLREFIEKHCTEDFLNRLKEGLDLTKVLVPDGDKFVNDDEVFSIFACAIDSAWQANQSASADFVLGKANENVFHKYEEVVLYRKVVQDMRTELDDAKTKAEQDGTRQVRDAKLAFLKEIEDLTLVETNVGDVYESMQKAWSMSGKKDEEPRQALKANLAGILEDGIKLLDGVNSLKGKPLRELTNVEIASPKTDREKLTDTTKLRQGAGTNLCYLRCVENGLIAAGKAGLLPEPKNGTYTFTVDIGGKKSNLTVTEGEIESIKKWYDANVKLYRNNGAGLGKPNVKTRNYKQYALYGFQKASYSDLDWAVDIALVKRAMWKDAQKLVGGKVQVTAPGELGVDKADSDEIALTGGYGKPCQSYLEDQLITSMGRDTDVAELFGLKEGPNFAINHDIADEDTLLKARTRVQEPKSQELFARWNRVRQWKAANPEGILTLNEASTHFVSVQDFYYESEGDFGFIVRDSNDAGGEKKINVNGYAYGLVGQQPEEGQILNNVGPKECDTLHVHCFLPVA